jgi:hypothetical protein
MVHQPSGILNEPMLKPRSYFRDDLLAAAFLDGAFLPAAFLVAVGFLAAAFLRAAGFASCSAIAASTSGKLIVFASLPFGNLKLSFSRLMYGPKRP